LTCTINKSNANSRVTTLDDSENKQKEKKDSIDLERRARITFAATADIDESKAAHVSHEQNLTSEEIKDYMADVLEEIKGTKNKQNKTKQKE
jgi:hypothetical protein